jgi:hypothetical protein
MDKETCWELAAKAQHIVDVQTFYNTKESTGEENDQDHQDFWNDLNCLLFLQIELMLVNINEEDLRIKKRTQNYVIKGYSISKDCWYLNLKKGKALSWKCTMRLGILENNRP